MAHGETRGEGRTRQNMERMVYGQSVWAGANNGGDGGTRMGTYKNLPVSNHADFCLP